MRKIKTFFLFLIFILPAISIAEEVTEECSSVNKTLETKKYASYEVKIFIDNDHLCQKVKIFKDKKIVYGDGGIDFHYTIGKSDEKNIPNRLIGQGRQLVIRRWTGGAHCCYSFLIFDLGKQFKKITEIAGGNFEPEFVDLNNDGIFEMRILDDFLAEQFSSFASSAWGEVVLKYKGGSYQVAPEFMKKPSPDLHTQNKLIKKWNKLLLQERTPDWPPQELIQEFTDLVYSGHKSLAMELLKKSWPVILAGKDKFLNEYQDALQGSRFYGEFEKIK